jgi:hypothetical protein
LVLIAEEWNFLFLGWPGAPGYRGLELAENERDQRISSDSGYSAASAASWHCLEAAATVQQIINKLKYSRFFVLV